MDSTPDPRFAEVRDLGELQSLHPRTLVIHYIWLASAGLAAIVTAFSPTGWESGTVYAAILAVIVVIAFIAVHRRHAAAIFERGFAHHDGSTTWSTPWTDIQRLNVVEYDDGQGHGYVDYVVIAAGRSRTLPRTLRDFEVFWQTLCLQAALAALDADQPIRFGPFIVSASALLCREGGDQPWSTPWERIKSISFPFRLFRSEAVIETEDGPLTVRLVGELRADLIPDRSAFLRLFRLLQNNRRPPAASGEGPPRFHEQPA